MMAVDHEVPIGPAKKVVATNFTGRMQLSPADPEVLHLPRAARQTL